METRCAIYVHSISHGCETDESSSLRLLHLCGVFLARSDYGQVLQAPRHCVRLLASAELDLRLAAVTAQKVAAILIAVRERARVEVRWNKLRVGNGAQITKQHVKDVFASALENTAVQRSGSVIQPLGSPAFGDFEDAGFLYSDIPVRVAPVLSASMHAKSCSLS